MMRTVNSFPEKLIFKKLPIKSLFEIRRKFEETGLYKKKFIDSLMAGMTKTSLYAGIASKNLS